ncbi:MULTISPECIES: NUDIX domain-containing protein [unclassified Mesorhizobium]|uniref:NUDIX hydrolase n=1 Tax=unclassified Mesorhizobium TaxID=325217 RepID=UPI001CCF8B9E|nr:NUDIX domain-containing protein [Mesorhizobium sp. CO1-1-9]MBZ9727532.1 NUDIX domain-containing protein [Mesorhizobium sp. CO1-1-11]
MLVAPDGDVLVLRRSSTDTNWPGHWCWPGGKSEEGETPLQTATRETGEEATGPEMFLEAGPAKLLDVRPTPQAGCTTRMRSRWSRSSSPGCQRSTPDMPGPSGLAA